MLRKNLRARPGMRWQVMDMLHTKASLGCWVLLQPARALQGIQPLA